MSEASQSGPMCMFCGQHGRRLGTCDVCGRGVCEKCGNIQHQRGERRVVHDACLKKDTSGFSMIKFVE